MINLKFKDAAEAIAVLAAKAISQTDLKGVAVLPQTLFVGGARVDVVPLNGDGILMLPTGEMRDGGLLPDGSKAAPTAVMAQAPGIYLSLAWGGDTPPVFDAQYLDDQTRGVVNAPPANLMPLAEAKKAANQAILDFANSITNKIMAGYPEGETATWQAQADEAQIVIAGAILPTHSLLPILAANAAGVAVKDLPAETLTAFAQRVLAARGYYFQIVAQVQNLRVQGQAAIAAAQTVTELNAAMADLKAKGLAAAHAMGLA